MVAVENIAIHLSVSQMVAILIIEHTLPASILNNCDFEMVTDLPYSWMLFFKSGIKA